MLFYSFFSASWLRAAPQQEPGLWDVSAQHSEVLGPFRLEGPWEFHWQTLLEPESPVPEAQTYAPIGFFWNSVVTLPDGSKPPIYGYATYRIRLKGFTKTSMGYYLRVLATQVAARGILYPEQAPHRRIEVRSGQVGTDKESEKPSLEHMIIHFDPEPEETWIFLLQVSNFHYGAGGGARFPIMISQNLAAANFYDLSEKLSIFCMGIIGAVGVYCLLLFLEIRSEKAALFLGLACLAFFIQRGSGLSQFQSTATYIYSVKIRWIADILIFAFYLCYIRYALPKLKFQRLLFLTLFLDALWVMIILLSPIEVFSSYRDPLMLLGLCQGTFSIALTLYASYWRHEGALPIAIGLAFCFVGITYDMLMFMNVFSYTFETFTFCFSLAALIQNKSLVQRTSEAHSQAARFARKMLQQEAMRTHFFHNVSHELRNPLNGIIGFLQLLCEERYGPLTEASQKQMQKVMHLVLNLKHQVNSILDIAKAQQNSTQVQRRLVAIETLKQEADILAEGLCLLQEGLSYESRWIFEQSDQPFIGDEGKLRTILHNLLSNAFKYKDVRRPNHVRLLFKTDANGLHIEIHDQGIGIPLTQQQTIFEPFQRSSSATQGPYEGSGLGLPLVRDFVSALGGQIQLSSEPGKGTSIRIQIPSFAQLDPIDPNTRFVYENSDFKNLASSNEPVPLQAAESSSSAQFRGKVLVVDDYQLNAELIVAQLSARQYNVQLALSGREGLQKMRDELPDVVLLDLMMPEMSGEDVLKIMRDDPNLSDIPVILITGRASDEERISGLSLGADDYLSKPILAEELHWRVDNMLRRHHLLVKMQELEAQSRFVQLGEMLQDLSHEMKNILHAAAQTDALTAQDIALSLAAVHMDEEFKNLLIDGILARRPHPDTLERMELLVQGPQDQLPKIRRSLRWILAECEIPSEDLIRLWNHLQAQGPEELMYLHSQLHLIQQYMTVLAAMKRCRELTGSILSLTHARESEEKANIFEAWQQVQSMVQVRLRKHHIHLSCEVESLSVQMNPQSLLQILLNLCLNALDELTRLPQTERWIEVYTEQESGMIRFVMQNAGAPIPEDIADKIFDRGFTTKGKHGSGVGLFLARRMARSCRGELSLSKGTQHPSFCLALPRIEDARTELDSVSKAG